MPTYDYRCNACNHTFDEFQSFSEPPLKKCPQCKKNKLQRLFGTGAAFIFKGSGFYETENRSASYKEAAKADQAPKPATDDKNGTAAAGSNGGAGANKTASAAENKSEPAKKSSKSRA